MTKEAILYGRLAENKVRCHLCAHRCIIGEGRRGICSVRENRQGILYSLVYGKLSSTAIDPIEKKPLFHFQPGSTSLSLSTVGCNMRCQHCQNSSLSQYPCEHEGQIVGAETTPEQIVDLAANEGCRSISYTYTEPTIFMEFALDCARLAHDKGIKNVFVSNGFMTPESARMIIPYLDGNNIDLKGDEEFYKNVCAARLDPVKETIRIMMEEGVWVEVTTLIIPGLNDSEEVLRGIADFIKSLDTAIPWHVTAFYPTYKMLDRRRTPEETLVWARRMGFEAGLKYVYEGNVRSEGGENTYCPRCKELLVERIRFNVITNALRKGHCPKCDTLIEGVWE